MEYRFVNDDHEKAYHDAVALLKSEDERAQREIERLRPEITSLPERLQQEKFKWLRDHFRACREPYEKLLGEILVLASPIIILPKSKDGQSNDRK